MGSTSDSLNGSYSTLLALAVVTAGCGSSEPWTASHTSADAEPNRRCAHVNGSAAGLDPVALLGVRPTDLGSACDGPWEWDEGPYDGQCHYMCIGAMPVAMRGDVILDGRHRVLAIIGHNWGPRSDDLDAALSYLRSEYGDPQLLPLERDERCTDLGERQYSYLWRVTRGPVHLRLFCIGGTARNLAITVGLLPRTAP